MAHSVEAVKILVQCDFDGTITMDDVSFVLLDAFADGDWRRLLAEYRDGKISVGDFNTKAFAMVKSDEQTLLDFIKDRVEIRAGFVELWSYCSRRDLQFVIVSNGLDFYIEKILNDMGLENVEVFAARTHFNPEGIQVNYIGPEGNQLKDDFKGAYTRLFLSKGYRVIYVGNGISDLSPAKLAYQIFATGDLAESCKQLNINYIPFADLNDVVKGLELTA